MEGVLTEAHLANLTKLEAFRLTTYPNRSLILNVKHDWVPPFRPRTLVLINCKVGPSFPVWLQVQTNLSYVTISNAGISDTIEEEWFAALFYMLAENIGELMPQLETFFLSRNQISGSLPSSICKMKGLKFLSAGHNRFSGELPNCWNNLPSLKVLDVSNNSLSGKIPSSLTSSCGLVLLIMNNNNLRGNIPYPLHNCRQAPGLYILHLGSNLLEGNIPEQLCFVGSISKCFQNFTALKYGSSSLDYDELFNLQDSTTDEQTILVGTKGRELEYSRTLLEVNLSKKNLSGEIPDGICSLAFLDSVNLSRNRLSGSIPHNIGDLRYLESLDLSHKNLSRAIPPSFSSLAFLGHLKLSYSNLSGRIPTGNQLQTLNDSSNYEGNPLLCGVPLETRCPGDNSPPTPPPRGGCDGGDSKDKPWLYLSTAMGFIVGFWSVIPHVSSVSPYSRKSQKLQRKIDRKTANPENNIT
ncbi:hypothetical protein PTKIN_Ptkin03bG0153600 [Pterospermum kingtungense]